MKLGMKQEQQTRGLLVTNIILSLVILIMAIVGMVMMRNYFKEEKQDEVSSLVNIEDYRKYAEKSMLESSWLVIKGGVANEHSVTENEAAFRRIKIMPKVLLNVSGFSTEVTVFGQSVSMPIAIAPTAFLRMAHPEGDIMVAQAAHAQNFIYGQSVDASSSIEEVASAVPDSLRWQQIYLYKNLSVSLHLVHRAKQNGAKAIIVTVDRTVRIASYDSMTGRAFVPENIVRKNWEMYGDPDWQRKNLILSEQTWEKLEHLCNVTSLPVVVKGILNVDDVVKCARAGASGVIVSNHGGRVLDEVPAPISVLREVTFEAKKYDLEVFMDGGIRSGLDVFKALASGAKLVFIGRPTFWGLTNGQEGVENVLKILQDEFKKTAQTAGLQSIADIDESFLTHF